MDNVLSVLGIIGVVIYFITKHRETLEKLTKMQNIGILFTYIITSLIAGCVIYYGGAMMKEWFKSGILLTIIQFVYLIIVLSIAIYMLNRILRIITKGSFQGDI
ncbi:hypothetical protein [Ornithinibacillus scapharcae]|uniref:hypothetical protein n=1 Tax=Ornithinibacillus scapharcae TaxID=1147159 RepID=UPI000225B0AA|nr:hypothetical protein [Ornithinibacillus scapharcae]